MKSSKREPTDSGSEKPGISTKPWYKNIMAVLALVSALVAAVSGLIALIQRLEPTEYKATFETEASGQPPANWVVKGQVRIVETGESKESAYGEKACEFEHGSAAEQRVDIPPEKSWLTISYRAPSGRARSTLEIYLDVELMLRVPPLDTSDWYSATLPVPESLSGKTVWLKIQYNSSTSGVGGRLFIPERQSDDVLWVDNIEIRQVEEGAQIAQATIEPSATPSTTASSTPAPRQPTLAPSKSPSPSPEAAEARPTRAPRQTTPIAAAAVITEPLSFIWSIGEFRQSGTNEQGIGIWAQEVFVEPSGGTPPYTILFNGQAQGDSFEIFGLFCEGQIGVITVRSTDGQEVRENITVKDPICPTKTPTPTYTQTPTETPTPTVVPLPPLPISGDSRITIQDIQIQGQGQRATVAAGSLVTVDASYFVSDPYCPGCIVQILIGISDDATINQAEGCVYSGLPGSAGVSGRGSTTFNAPGAPGVYYLRFRYAEDYSCQLGWWTIDFTPGPDRNIGAIIVP